jgi:hypothetical protein
MRSLLRSHECPTLVLIKLKFKLRNVDQVVLEMIETADTAVICLIYKLIDSIRNKKELPKQ